MADDLVAADSAADDTVVDDAVGYAEMDNVEDEALPTKTHPASATDAAAFVEVNKLVVSGDGQEVDAPTTTVLTVPPVGSGLVPELV